MKLNETMENQYIDLMIKLALDMQEQREVEAVEQDDGMPADPPVQQSAQRALSSAYERISQDDRANRNRKALHIVGQCVASVLKAAACFALIAEFSCVSFKGYGVDALLRSQSGNCHLLFARKPRCII